MKDASRKKGTKLIRVLVVEINDCLGGIPYKRIRQALIDSEVSGHRYDLIEVPKNGTFYGVPIRDYVKPNRNLASINMGTES
jgi:hypothetical protein